MNIDLCKCCCCPYYNEQNYKEREYQSCTCMDSFHAKTIEIILIICFSGSIILFSIAIVVGQWAIISYIIFYIFISLLLLSVVEVVFSILIRIWRANNSILNTNYSKSLCFSKLLYLIIIISFLCSCIQFIFISWSIDKDKKSKIGIKRRLYNTHANDANITKTKNGISKESKEYSLAILSITYNIVAQCFMSFFLCHLIKRIKGKTTYGEGSTPHINVQRNIEPNPVEFNPNQVDNFNQRKDV